MKISPMGSSANTVGAIPNGAAPQAPVIQTPRSLKMNTNATPGRVEAQIEELPPAPLTNSDPNDKAEGTPEATEPLSPQFAALAKQRRALQQERQAFEKEKAEFQSKAPAQGDSISLADLKANPLSVLLNAGVTYDQLTEAILANQNGNGPEIQALKAEIKALKEGVDKTLTDRDAAAEKQVLAEMEREATRLAAQGEDFELVRETKSIPVVIDLIEKTYRKTGEVLDVAEAMKLVEDDLIEDTLRKAALQKVQSKLAPSEPAPNQPQQRPPMRTLTNRDTAQVPMSRKQRALAAFHGTLKK